MRNIMEKASVITYAGDSTLFEDLEMSLIEAIPKESTEWKRPYGRAVKCVVLEANFIAFSKDLLPKSGEWKLIGQPILHTFWTECADLETYKTTLKSEIEQWFKCISGADWMIILVEVYDIRKSNKLLPRTTVLDKIRADFGVKQGDRVIGLIHPIKSESKSAESWRGLVNRIRVLMLSSYTKVLSKFEETVRANRECRPQPNWSFCNYFTMQEELALVLENLGLHEEALVQYDELDALFTQFVLNSTKGETPKWLASFTVPLQQWAGPTLCQEVTSAQRDLLRCSKLNLIQFRSYLFGRQCSLLLKLSNPAEIAQRAFAFLHNCVLETRILEVTAPEGALSTWVFLVCLEVLGKCEQFKDTALVNAYSLHTAGLWSYARDKLKELGTLCGLAPGPGPTSQQLHMVVELSSGMGDPLATLPGPTPVERLKEALSSKNAYNSYFLELSELSISTYKHIGRMRFARRIGLDLAEFYLAVDQPDKAVPFITSALQGFQDDDWPTLTANTQLRLVTCFSTLAPDIKYTTCCAAIASSTLTGINKTYYNKFIESLKSFAQGTPAVTSFRELGFIKETNLEPRHRIRRGKCLVRANLKLVNLLPGPLSCDCVRLSVEKTTAESSSQRNDELQKFVFNRLPMFELVDYKQDGAINGANIVCREPRKALMRTDSQGRGRKLSMPVRRDFTHCLQAKDITLLPGENSLELTWMAENAGEYLLGQLSILVGGLEFLQSVPSPLRQICIEEEKSKVEVRTCSSELLAGLPQRVDVFIEMGSYAIPKGTEVHVLCSPGLTATVDSTEGKFMGEFLVELDEAEPFSLVSIPLLLLTELPADSDGDGLLERSIIITCPWCNVTLETTHCFLRPLGTSMRLNSVRERKFLQIVVSGLSTARLRLQCPNLEAAGTTVKQLNLSNDPMIVASGVSVSWVWEIQLPEEDIADSIAACFSLQYSLHSFQESSAFFTYKCHFNINQFKTLYIVRCNLEGGKDADFCRVGAMCQLNLEVTRSFGDDGADCSLMYEVYADQAMWAICGRAAGVMTLSKEKKQNVVLEVMPLIQGFLPLPNVRLSRYIPASDKDPGNSRPRLEPFSIGQVYSASKAEQVHVLPAGTND